MGLVASRPLARPVCAEPVSAYTDRVIFFAPQPKRSAIIAKHGYDPADFEAAFGFDRFLSRRAKPSPTDRERLMLVGMWFGDAVVTVILSSLGTEACDVVSVRYASDEERAVYDAL